MTWTGSDISKTAALNTKAKETVNIFKWEMSLGSLAKTAEMALTVYRTRSYKSHKNNLLHTCRPREIIRVGKTLQSGGRTSKASVRSVNSPVQAGGEGY